MASKTRQKSGTQSSASFMDFEEHELQQTLNEFMDDKEQERPANIWNFATIAGIAMLLVVMVYMIQAILGLGVGPDLAGFVEFLPLIGGILVTLVGFGFFVGDRKREKQAKKKREEERKKRTYDFESTEQKKGAYKLDNDLSSKGGNRRFSDDKYQFDRYAFRQRKKLYKSRSNKKLAGVCGGLAEYFGISTTVVRFLFIFAFFAGSGTSLLVYIALAIALDKEPPELDKYGI
ncbi:PspC domain-containing protein [Fodinibius sediminis]|uniref:Phage shock protein C (PspC) family protein n=1 Tax=Fodinibius sediminis TaxID=1214077 RepID=A0A521B2I7_9BACT|nr:PspC domain-containing protein [Fodinibius sediminis]SMO41241.1 phage shock protein C (PspC) family protein [Fodinibius sediminis]